MLDAIRKFFRERRADAPPGRLPVVADDAAGDPTGQPEPAPPPAALPVEEPSAPPPAALPVEEASAPPPAAPSVEEPSAPPVAGKVKWFNPGKRYGFVELSDGAGDAFLHASVLARAGIDAVLPGATLTARVAPGERGPQVTEIIAVDSSTAATSQTPPDTSGSPYDRSAAEASLREPGIVKWYSAAKGFGFIVRDGGGKDVFVHASVLQRSGIANLAEGQRVTVGIVEGRKGPEAGSIELT